MLFRKLFAGLVALSAVVPLSGAHATLLTGPETIILIDDDPKDGDANAIAGALEDAEITIGVFLYGEQKGPLFAFPIVNSSFDGTTTSGAIDHEGGIEFLNANGESVLLENFFVTIDADGVGVITGDVVTFLDGQENFFTDIDLFTFDLASLSDNIKEAVAMATDTTNPMLALFGAPGVIALLAALGLELPEGFDGPIAFLATGADIGAPMDMGMMIPLPAAVYFLLAGLVGLRFASRKKARA